MFILLNLIVLSSVLFASKHDRNCPFPQGFLEDPRFSSLHYSLADLCDRSKWPEHTIGLVLRGFINNREQAAIKMIFDDSRFDPSLVFEAHPGNRCEATIKTLIKYYFENHEEQRLIDALQKMFDPEITGANPMSPRKFKGFKEMVAILFGYVKCSHEMMIELESIVVGFLTRIASDRKIWACSATDYRSYEESGERTILDLLNVMMNYIVVPVGLPGRKMSMHWYNFLTKLIQAQHKQALYFILGRWGLFTDRISLAKVPEGSPSLLNVASSAFLWDHDVIEYLSMNRDIFLSIFSSESKNRAGFYIRYLPDAYKPLVEDETMSAEEKYVAYIQAMKDGIYFRNDRGKLAELLHGRTSDDV